MLVLSGHKDVMKIIVPERAICMKKDDEKEYIIAYPGSHLPKAKNRYVFIERYCMYNSFALSTF
jgi:hypothetical protein